MHFKFLTAYMKSSKSILDQQIKVYLHYCVRQGMLEGTYNFWLKEFGQGFKGCVYDINENDKVEFLTKVSVLYDGQFSLNQAERAINGLISYYRARSRNVAKCRELGYNDAMGITDEKFERNRELVLKRLSDRKKWSWRALGSHFNIHFTTARQIFKSNAEKYREKELSTV